MTLSTMAPLGTRAPGFSLPDVVSGKTVRLEDAAGVKGTLVMFISRHCPYIQHVKSELTRLGKDYAEKGLGIVAISSNDIVNYPDDAPAKLKKMTLEEDWIFPVLYDETQEVARAYTAACTPDFFLYGPDLRLVYRGQLDSSRPGNQIPVTGQDLRAALDALLAGKPISPDQKPSAGCSIKWKPAT